jgi:hypothetical protein
MGRAAHVRPVTIAASAALWLGVLAPCLASEPPSLALPDGAPIAAGVNDTPPTRSGPVDLGAVADAALAQADRLPASLWDLDALALELAFDLPAMHAFVRDHIAYDPYPGVLRGADGTLSARSGSAWDRALLLFDLVSASGYDARFVTGVLGDADTAALLAAAPVGPRVPLPDPAMADVVAVDAARLAARAQRDHTLLLEALGGHVTWGAEPDRAQIAREHVWVQARDDDGTWRDLDPEAPFGEALAPAATHHEAVPEDVLHAFVLRAVTETLDAGILREAVVLEERLVAAEAADMELWFYLQPDREGVGGAIARVFEGSAWLPILLVDGEARRGTSFELGGAAGGLFGGGFFGSAGAELVSLRLELASLGPGLMTVTERRVLFDRAPAGWRAAVPAGDLDADALRPLPADGAPSAFGGLHHVLVSTGGANPRQHAVGRAVAASFAGHDLLTGDAEVSYAVGDLLFPLAVADQTLVLGSERLIVDGLAGPGVRAFVGRPRAFLVSLLPFPELPDGTLRVIDLALDGIDVAVGADAAPGAAARHRLWYGVLQTALETEASLQAASAVDPASALVDSVSLAMPGAVLSTVTPDEIAAVPPDAASLHEALNTGHLAVVVGGPERFWAVDPASGATRSVLDPGLHAGRVSGRGYVNASAGGPRYVVDPRTGRSLGYVKDGTYYRYGRTPPSRCSGGTEYVVLLGCVSIPAGMTVGMATGAVVTAAVSWAIVLLELWLL